MHTPQDPSVFVAWVYVVQFQTVVFLDVKSQFNHKYDAGYAAVANRA